MLIQVFDNLMQPLIQNLQIFTCLHISNNKLVPHAGRDPYSLKVIQSKYIKNECELVK